MTPQDLEKAILNYLESYPYSTTGTISREIGMTSEKERKRVSKTIARLRDKGIVGGDYNTPKQWIIIKSKEEMEDVTGKDAVEATTDKQLWSTVLSRLEVIMAEDISKVLKDIRGFINE